MRHFFERIPREFDKRGGLQRWKQRTTPLICCQTLYLYSGHKLFLMKKAEQRNRITSTAGKRRGKTVKCSSCKQLKSTRDFKPIMVNGKRVVPKTCQLCRAKRTQYYWSKFISSIDYSIEYECREAREKGIRPPPRHVPHHYDRHMEFMTVDDDSLTHSEEQSTTSEATLPEEIVHPVSVSSPTSSVQTMEDDSDDFHFVDDDLMEELRQNLVSPSIALPTYSYSSNTQNVRYAQQPQQLQQLQQPQQPQLLQQPQQPLQQLQPLQASPYSSYSSSWKGFAEEPQSIRPLSRVNSIFRLPSDHYHSSFSPAPLSNLFDNYDSFGLQRVRSISSMREAWNQDEPFDNLFSYSSEVLPTSDVNTWLY